MKTLPCSRALGQEPHDLHVYFYSGYDVECPGFAPPREPHSDQAETPEEFFGLHPITKKPDFEGYATKWHPDEVVMVLDESPNTNLSKFQRAVLWYENLRPIKKDLVWLVTALVILTIWMLLLTAVLP